MADKYDKLHDIWVDSFKKKIIRILNKRHRKNVEHLKKYPVADICASQNNYIDELKVQINKIKFRRFV